ncbi:MAG: MerC domain-containing protein [Gammaproteobacteria bacterium]|nr:MerC domain-containing protein [Gammaproteobacteria bacterium]MCY4199297.1 MerC domain-containing protein [Gammaproteobacteria bacterium]MCY4277623.1 MerC domain-containing protein [Gammaproteobacteria bacterium]MCY4322818.1 MerC domain-containing protein [Gammaproteobacteria bacterium]
MKTLQEISDKMAIGLSLLCAIHCLAMPLAAVMLPSVAALSLDDELYHLWMLIAVFPVSAYALTLGCTKHKRYQLVLVGGAGLLLLGAAAFLGHDLLGHTWERLLTLIGASIIALGHFFNFRLCRRHEGCGCAETMPSTALQR